MLWRGELSDITGSIGLEWAFTLGSFRIESCPWRNNAHRDCSHPRRFLEEVPSGRKRKGSIALTPLVAAFEATLLRTDIGDLWTLAGRTALGGGLGEVPEPIFEVLWSHLGLTRSLLSSAIPLVDRISGVGLRNLGGHTHCHKQQHYRSSDSPPHKQHLTLKSALERLADH